MTAKKNGPHRVTGMLVTFQWSKQGKWVSRRTAWGTRAKKAWDGEKLSDSVWLFPKAVTFSDVDDWLEANLTAADRAVVAFPHGKRGTASAMSVHTYNV